MVDAHHDLKWLALPFTYQPCTGDRTVVQPTAPDLLFAAIELLAQHFKALGTLFLQASVGQFLDAVRQAGFKEAAVERGRVLVEDFTAVLRRTDFVALVGPNGAGKSSFISTILGDREPAQGEHKFRIIASNGLLRGKLAKLL